MAARASEVSSDDYYVRDTIRQLTALLKATDSRILQETEDFAELEDPSAAPAHWISKWFDYSDKYGLGYQLCDNSVGVLFNDCTTLVLDAAGEQMQYVDRESNEHRHTASKYPPELEKKVQLIHSFRDYLQNLVKAGENYDSREDYAPASLRISLVTWLRTKSAILLVLSNGTVQINFVEDHTKLIICPLKQAVTFVDKTRVFRTFKFADLEQKGCPQELYHRLGIAKKMLEQAVERRGTPGFVDLNGS